MEASISFGKNFTRFGCTKQRSMVPPTHRQLAHRLLGVRAPEGLGIQGALQPSFEKGKWRYTYDGVMI